MIMMNRSFNDTAKTKEWGAYSRVTTLHNSNAYTDEDKEINSHQREESTIEAQKLNKSASCIEPKGVSIKSLEVDNPAELTNETKEPSVPQCGYKVYKPLRNPYNATLPSGDTRHESMMSSQPQNLEAIKPYKR